MRLHKTTYFIHKECLATAPLPETHASLILEGLFALQQAYPQFDFNVVECDNVKGKCTFSRYNFRIPWPVLQEAIRYHANDQSFGRVPIRQDSKLLFHIEQILPEWHPYHQAAHRIDELTRERQLYAHVREPVTVSKWFEQLRRAAFNPLPLWHPPEDMAIRSEEPKCQLNCRGCCLAYEEGKETARHRTALRRRKLSRPMLTALRSGIITKETTVLDYGCGQGEDAAYLQDLGITVWAWDPVFRPHGELREADVVNLGYVINVIENPFERLQTLQRAFALAKNVLIVSAQVVKRGQEVKGTSLGDGVLTKRGTFQKYFTQAGLRQYIEAGLGKRATMAGPGIFYVFRDAVKQRRGRQAPRGRAENHARPPEIDEACRASPVGKLLPDALYVHRSAISRLPPTLQRIIKEATECLPEGHDFTLVKVSRRKPTVSFLYYPDFDLVAHPKLAKTVVINYVSRSLVSNRSYPGPDGYILHRKEIFVDRDYQYFEQFRMLTQMEEEAGLLGWANIGSLSTWNDLLQQHGFQIINHQLLELP